MSRVVSRPTIWLRPQENQQSSVAIWTSIRSMALKILCYSDGVPDLLIIDTGFQCPVVRCLISGRGCFAPSERTVIS